MNEAEERKLYEDWLHQSPEFAETIISAWDAWQARAALSAPAVPQWMPIESAPKDVYVLVACPSGYTTTEWVFTTAIMCTDYKRGRWIDHANDDLSDWGMVPAHWMPLPAAPQPQEQT